MIDCILKSEVVAYIGFCVLASKLDPGGKGNNEDNKTRLLLFIAVLQACVCELRLSMAGNPVEEKDHTPIVLRRTK